MAALGTLMPNLIDGATLLFWKFPPLRTHPERLICKLPGNRYMRRKIEILIKIQAKTNGCCINEPVPVIILIGHTGEWRRFSGLSDENRATTTLQTCWSGSGWFYGHGATTLRLLSGLCKEEVAQKPLLWVSACRQAFPLTFFWSCYSNNCENQVLVSLIVKIEFKRSESYM